MTAQERLIQTAQAEVGYLEKKTNDAQYIYDKTANSGTNNFNKYAYDLDKIGNIFNGKKNGYDWCAVFCAWCYIQTFGVDTAMKMTGFAYNGLAAGVRYAANYYKNKGRFYTSKPQPGDQIFFYGNTIDVWQHTGLVEKVDGSKVYTIEGNTSNASGVIYNGGGVARKSYALNYSRIAGYGRPDWSIVKEDDDDMTGEEIYNKMMDYLRSLPTSEYAKESSAKGVASGYFKDGNGDKLVDDPHAPLKRQEFAEVLNRMGLLDK